MVTTWVKSLDGLLRGEATRITALKSGTIEVPVSGLSILIIVLGALTMSEQI